MTIHHDKFAYGKLESLDEQISPEGLKKMVSEANEASKDANDEADEGKAETEDSKDKNGDE